MKKGIFIYLFLSVFTLSGIAQTVTDMDGNVYNIITIGTQSWMKENYRAQSLNDGTSISLITDDNLWETATSPAFCNYNNTENLDTINLYGRLYNWNTVASNKLCPTGWHVPTTEDWNTLFSYLDNSAQDPVDGGSVSSIANVALNDSTSLYWSCSEKMTDISSFTALPGGYRTYSGEYITFGSLANFWTSTSFDEGSSWKYDIGCNEVYKSYYNKQSGFSVRCIEGNTSEVSEISAVGSIEVYPNPTSDILKIENNSSNTLTVSIYNFSGAVILKKTLHNGKNEINTSNLKQGLYLVTVKDGAVTKNSEVIIKE